MATFTHETKMTGTRRYLLPLPSNNAEMNKMATVAFIQWRRDHGTESDLIPGDAISISVEDDVLVYSWEVPNRIGSVHAATSEELHQAWADGYATAFNPNKTSNANPYTS